MSSHVLVQYEYPQESILIGPVAITGFEGI